MSEQVEIVHVTCTCTVVVASSSHNCVGDQRRIAARECFRRARRQYGYRIP